MHELWRKYAANGFAEFRGLVIQGQVPMKEQLLNELIAEWLKGGITTQEKAEPGFDTKPLVGLVKKLEVHAEAGVVRVDFELRA